MLRIGLAVERTYGLKYSTVTGTFWCTDSCDLGSVLLNEAECTSRLKT